MNKKEPIKITKAFLKHLNKQMEKSALELVLASYGEGYVRGFADAKKQFKKTDPKDDVRG